MSSLDTHTLNTSITVNYATLDDVDAIAPLLDAYRQFYGQPSNLPAARYFLRDRLMNMESIVIVAWANTATDPASTTTRTAAGFVQLYETFSTVRLIPVWILNDLFVSPEFRNQGIATQLMNAAKAWVLEREDGGLQLETAPDNTTAQHLYQTCGFTRNDTFHHYHWTPSN